MPELVIVSQTDVPRLLPMRECIEVMHGALVALAEGRTILPLRTVIPLPQQRGAFACMPAVIQGQFPTGAAGANSPPLAMGVKVLTVYPANEGTAFDSHQGAVLLFEPEHGSPVALLDASSITAIRTAAVSAVATRALSRSDASTLALIGSGVQAATHLESMLAVRPIREVRVHSRTVGHAEAFAKRESTRHGIVVEAMGTAEQAVRGADIICTLTSSRTPVLHGDWLAPGCHINAIGSSSRVARELDGLAVQRSRLFVDRRESTLNESGDFLLAREEGLVDDQHIIGEIGEVLTERVPGRTQADQITLFKSLGLAIEDVAAAQHIYQRLNASSGAARVNLGGNRPLEAQPPS